MTTVLEPRTSLERALIDSDLDGQLYLEARRQQALDRLRVDHDSHRLSRLSTITPPSSASSSASSSIFNEPRMGSFERGLDQPSSLTLGEQGPPLHQHQQPPHQPGPAPPQTPSNHPMVGTTTLPPCCESTPEHNSLILSSSKHIPHQQQQQQPLSQQPQQLPPTETTFKTMRKARQYLMRKRNEKQNHASSSIDSPSSNALLPSQFSPSSFEYQLTASLLAHPSPSSTRQSHHHPVAKKKASQSSFTKRTRRRSRQGSRPYNITVDTSKGAVSAKGGSKSRGATAAGSGGMSSSSRIDGQATAAMLGVEPLAPFSTDDSPPSTWSPSSPPGSPFGGSALEGSSFMMRGKASALSASQATLAARPSDAAMVEPLPQDSLQNVQYAPLPGSGISSCTAAAGESTTAAKAAIQTLDRDTPVQLTSTTTTTTNNNNSNSKNTSIPLPPIPPSPPLPPVPPRTLSNLIAQYFPGSLPPPPPRVAGAGPRRGSGIAAVHTIDAKSPSTSQHSTEAAAASTTSLSAATATATTTTTTPTLTTSLPAYPPSLYVPRRPPSTTSLRSNVKTPTFGPALLTSPEDAPPVPAIAASARSALLQMASSIAAAASAATVSAAGSSSDSVDLSRSRSKTNTIATMSTASGSSSPESLHPALVSTSAFGVFPPSPSMRHQHPPLPPPNTTVAIPVPLPLSKLRTTTTAAATSSTPTISEDVHVPSDNVFLSNPSSHSTVSLPSTNNHNNTYHNSSAAKGSPTFTAASGNNSPKRPSPLGKPRSLPGAPRRPPVTPHVSFEGRYPSIITTAATVPSTPTTTGGGNEGSTGPFYPTGLKDTTSAGPSALLGSKLSPHYYRAALYGSDSSNSSSSSLFFKARSGSGNGGSGSNGSGRDASGHVVSGEEGRKGVHYDGSHFSKKGKNKRMPGSNTSITFEPQSRLAVSMTSSELDPLHYLEKKPLPAVRLRVMSDVTGSDSLFAEGGRRRGPFRRLFVMTTTTRRWWVFRDQDGWMIGPWLFLLGFLFPPLWWVGALYRAKPPKEKKPRPPMPKKQKEKEIHLAARLFGGGSGGGGGVGEGTKEEDVAKREESKAGGAKTADENSSGGADERQTLHSTVISPPASRSKHQQQPTISESELVLEMEQLAKMETPPHGPWSVEHKATLIFQERMRRDRHERRAQLEARWRTVNLVFAYSSLVLIVAICAIVFTIL